MLRDIGHAYAEGKRLFDVTFEDVHAGERTGHRTKSEMNTEPK
jgi:NAD+ synthase (glutamine-hydrolysing)